MAKNEDVQRIEIEVTANTSKAKKEIKSLTKDINDISKNAKPAEDLGKTMVDGVQKATGAVEKLSTAFNDAGEEAKKVNFAKSLNANLKTIYGDIKKITSLLNLSKNLDFGDAKGVKRFASEVQRSVDKIKMDWENLQFDEANGEMFKDASLDDFIRESTEAISKADELSGKLKEIGNQGDNKNKVAKSTTAVKSAMSKATPVVKRFVNELKKLGRSALNSISSGLRKVGSSVTSGITAPFRKATGVVSKFASSMKKILFYRVVRQVISSIMKAISEASQNLYMWSKTADGVFAKSMDDLATSAFYLKNSFAAALAPTINALVPVVEKVVDVIVSLLNKINELSAKLTGAKTYTVARKVATSYAESATEATEATEELKRSLLGFDKITKLDEPKKSSGGSGSDTPDYSSMFENRTVNNDTTLSSVFTDWADELNEKLGSIDWADIQSKAYQGALEFGQAITDGINETDWELVGSSVSEGLVTVSTAIQGFFDGLDGTTVGEAINDFFSGFDGTKVGKSIAAAINSAVKTINDTLKNINFTNIGKKLADVANGLLDIDWKTIGENVKLSITGIFDTITGFAENFDWSGLGDKLAEFFEGLSGDDLSASISKGLNSILAGIRKTLQNKDFWKNLGSFGADLVNSIVSINWGDVSGTISDFLKGLFDSCVTLLSEVDWEQLGKDIVDFILGIDYWGIITKANDLFQKAVAGVVKILKGILKGLWDHIVEWYHGLDSNKDGETSFSELFVGLIKAAVDGAENFLKNNAFVRLFDGIMEGLDIDFSIGATISEVAQGFIDWVTGVWGKATDKAKELSVKLAGVASGIWSWFKKVFYNEDGSQKTIKDFAIGIGGALNKVWSWFKSLFYNDDGTPKKITALAIGIGGALNKVWTWFKGLFFNDDGSRKKLSDLTVGLGGAFNKIWTWFKSLFFNDDGSRKTLEDLSVGLGGAFNKIWTWFKSLFFNDDGTRKTLKDLSVGLGGAFSSLWSWFKSLFFNDDGTRKTIKDLSVGLDGAFNSLWDWFKKTFFNDDGSRKKLSDLTANIGGSLGDTWDWFKSKFFDANGNVKVFSIVADITATISDWLKKVINWFTGGGDEDESNGTKKTTVETETKGLSKDELVQYVDAWSKIDNKSGKLTTTKQLAMSQTDLDKYYGSWSSIDDKSANITTTATTDSSYTSAKAQWVAWKNETVKKTRDSGGATDNYTKAKGYWDSWSNQTVKKTRDSGGATDNYTKAKGYWDSWGNQTVKKTRDSGGPTKAYTDAKGYWDSWSNQTVKKTSDSGGATKNYKDAKGYWDKWKDQTVKKTRDSGGATTGYTDAKKAWDDWKDKTVTVTAVLKDGISSAIASMMLAILGAMNSVIEMINKVLKTNMSYIKTPTWVMDNTLSADSINHYKKSGLYSSNYYKNGVFYKLARGGIITASQGLITKQMRNVNLAVGEAGKEAVLPLEQNTEWMDVLANKIYELTMSQQSSQQGQSVTIPVYVGGEKVSQTVINDINKRTAMTGVCPIRV